MVQCPDNTDSLNCVLDRVLGCGCGGLYSTLLNSCTQTFWDKYKEDLPETRTLFGLRPDCDPGDPGANKGIGLALVRVLLRERADTHLILAR